MNKTILIGAGPMAVQYAVVLNAMNTEYEVIGRGPQSAKTFEEKTGKAVIQGGLKAYLQSNPSIESAIVSTGVEALAENTIDLIRSGCKRILVEKPAGMTAEDIESVNKMANQHNCEVIVAYNRRFYQSVSTAIEMIKEDGGITSMHFEFTEVGFKIKDIPKAPGVKENWFLANSTHVVDLAFFIAGKPVEITCLRGGTTSWHPTAAQFTGAGKTEKNCLFSYHANWDGPGRWSLDLVTPQRRLILAPMEGLKIQKLGSFQIEDVELPDSPDQAFKPGLYQQTEAFLSGKHDERFCTISDTVALLPTYLNMSGYEQ
jgi:predicted dehydrogenase